MKFVYPAVFKKTENGTYKGSFPDLACCYGEGETLDEAIEKANEAAYNWIYLEVTDGGDLPPITEISDIPVKEGEIIRNISVNIRFTDGWDE